VLAIVAPQLRQVVVHGGCVDAEYAGGAGGADERTVSSIIT
jgi:hypothetical protein